MAPNKKQLDTHADIYSLIIRLDYLEKMFIRDVVSQQDYDTWCSKILSQLKTAIQLTDMHFEAFYNHYHMDCPAAKHRYLDGSAAVATTNSSKVVAEVVQYFITLMDACKLGMRSVDQLLPLLVDILGGLKRLNQAYPKLSRWRDTLDEMKASDDLDDEQIRQLSFDLDSAYTQFIAYLK